MKISSVRTNRRHQITIPKWACKQLNIQSGDHLLIDVQDGMLILLPLYEEYTRTLAGLHHEIWKDADQYILQERDAWIASTNSER